MELSEFESMQKKHSYAGTLSINLKFQFQTFVGRTFRRGRGVRGRRNVHASERVRQGRVQQGRHLANHHHHRRPKEGESQPGEKFYSSRGTCDQGFDSIISSVE